MAIDAYMTFQPYNKPALDCESKVNLAGCIGDLAKGFVAGQVFEIDEWSQLSIEQTLSIGSQSSGTGSGRVDFKEFSITRKIDKASPTFFNMACSGTPFQNVALGLRKASGGYSAGQFFLRFDFKLVAVKTITYSHDETSPKEEVTFEYGGFVLRYTPQNSDGSMGAVIPAGWDKTQNAKNLDPNWVISYKF